jgi:glycosyltransferase involved in cell wall biosynthesis
MVSSNGMGIFIQQTIQWCKMKNANNILFLAPYPEGYGPSQRFRLEVYFNSLKERNIDYDYRTFYSKSSYDKLYRKGDFISKGIIVLGGFLKRFMLLFSVFKYDFVFVQREITPIGPPIFEWIIAKVIRKKIIYDFDDAIWLPNYSKENEAFHKLKNYSKVKHIIKWSHSVIAGNDFLKTYALAFNNNTTVIPTVVNTNNVHDPKKYEQKSSEKLTIGWTGTLTTNIHIESLEQVFIKLNNKYNYDLLVISNKKPELNISNMIYQKWDKKNEISQLMQMDFGLMPLRSDKDFYKGKCGFKAIQYMSINIPTVISPIGVNALIVEDKKTGFHAHNDDDWFNIKVDVLISDARKIIIEQYSVQSQENKFISIFQ